MAKRFVAIWFPYLKTDWYARRIPAFGRIPFALAVPDHGRMIIAGRNAAAEKCGIQPGMAVADARAIHPTLHVLDDKEGHSTRILQGLAEWCIRYTPSISIDKPGGLIMDVTGCAHLWGGESAYLTEIGNRIEAFGYHVRIAIADSIGAAWAFSRFAEKLSIIESGEHHRQLLRLPAQSLRLEPETIERLHKLGLSQVKDFISIPRTALRRRFGQALLMRIDQALGTEEETIEPIQPVEPYESRLPCLEPIQTRTGIEIALQTLLDDLCNRLKKEGQGLRNCVFKGFRMDGKVECISIGTNRATHNKEHLFKLFELKIEKIEPALGIEFFLLQAGKVEAVTSFQEKLWEGSAGIHNNHLIQLLDRFAERFGPASIQRYLPDEHYWPERSMKLAASITEAPNTKWNTERPRPINLLSNPQPIEVMAPVPDYPPMHFRYKGELHKVIKADGPERIEQEWWLEQGEHRDYYAVEDEKGQRFWVFRSGHYEAEKFNGWFLHGFFA